LLEKIKRIDWSIILILLLFMVISTMLVYSATISDPKFVNFDIKKNVYIYIFGLFCFFIVTFIDFRFLVKTALYYYIVGIVLLITVLKWGSDHFGAMGWFDLHIAGLEFQPAELMKLILIIALTAFIARRAGEKLEFFRDVIPISVIVLVPFLLVLIQNDLGNAIIYLVILLGMFWIGNIKFKYVLIGTLTIVTLITAFYYLYTTQHDVIKQYLKPHYLERIDAFINPSTASEKARYQVEQSTRAIGSGMLTGDGFLKGDSIHKNYVPVAYTDAIFVVVGEEFGFVGASVLLLLYFLMIYRMILISIQTLDLSGSYIIVGIVSMFVFQIYENIGMLIGLMPLTGITLPFISYGGTSLVINMISIGIVMSIKVHQEKVSMFQE
jgi:rod shape determining protein RodA